eukprot:c36579_g1_i1 orf=611-823(-)
MPSSWGQPLKPSTAHEDTPFTSAEPLWSMVIAFGANYTTIIWMCNLAQLLQLACSSSRLVGGKKTKLLLF